VGTDIKVTGPSNDGINHAADEFVLLLNPQVDITIYYPHESNQSQKWRMDVDQADTNVAAGVADIQYVSVAELQNPSTMSPGLQAELARSWAGSGMGLTSADYANILALDPFASNPNVAINTSRYYVIDTSSIPYDPCTDGSCVTTTYSIKNTTGNQSTSTYTSSYTVGYTVGGSIFGLLGWSSTTAWTWTDSNTFNYSTQSSQSATLAIAQPSASYTGPTNVTVYLDTLYGTWLFAL
jgi:hypothetical protein